MFGDMHLRAGVGHCHVNAGLTAIGIPGDSRFPLSAAREAALTPTLIIICIRLALSVILLHGRYLDCVRRRWPTHTPTVAARPTFERHVASAAGAPGRPP